MASKAYSFFSFTLLTIFLSLLSHYSVLAHSNAEKESSPFKFVEHLKGCHKGDKVKGIHELKKYLEKFGYLNYDKSLNLTHANDDDFDELLEYAIKTYQLNYHLKSTGVLDDNTVAKMTTPRCGVADNVNGTRSDAINPVARAFQTWASNTHFKFSQTQDYVNADIKISFRRRNHGDGDDFDGRHGTLAHAFAPTRGIFHYDADEMWVVGNVPGAYDLETVALHEIGHLLGLHHSFEREAIMYADYTGVARALHGDDIQGIRALYNA